MDLQYWVMILITLRADDIKINALKTAIIFNIIFILLILLLS